MTDHARQHEAGRLIVVSDYGYAAGGIEQFIYELLARLRNEFNCQLLTWTDSTLTPSDFTALTLIEFGDIRRAWEAMDAADIVLVVTSFNVRLLARTAAEYLQTHPKPMVMVVQTSEHSNPSSSAIKMQEAWLRELVGRSRLVVAVSDEVETALLRFLEAPEDGSRIHVIENAARITSASKTNRTRRRISFVGRPHPQKGFHLFERLAGELFGHGLEFHANTVSVAADMQRPYIHYSRNLTTDELIRFFEQADVLVAPYLRADGLPLALLEAINCGTPIIGFDSPGVGSLLRRYGQVVIKPTYKSLREAVTDWISGRLHVKPAPPGSVPSWDVQIGKYAELLHSIRSP